MHNKIGINEYKLRSVEKNLVNLKLNILDETFTFNQNEFDFDYLVKLNKFLFNDFYFECEVGPRDLNKTEKVTIEHYLKLITSYCISDKDNIEKVLYLVEKIWNLQPFIVGNTRTMIALLKVLNEAFLLDLDVDVNKDISNNPSMFKMGNVVNQKRLTKNK